MKNSALLTVALISVAAVVVVLLKYTHMNTQAKNGFERSFNGFSARKMAKVDIKINSYYISGIAKGGFYLGNSQAPLNFLKVSYDLKETAYLRLPFKFSDQVMWGVSRLQVDSPDIYLSEQIGPSLLTGSLLIGNETITHLERVKFDLLKVISSRSIVVRGFDTLLRQRVLKKINLLHPEIKGQSYVPKIQQDGLFSVEGFFAFNTDNSRIFYTYYYRNEFICLDTNLQVLYTAKTIDTNSRAKIEVKEIQSGWTKVNMHAKPPLVVNKRSYSDGELLYINSSLIADNENREQFKGYSVIDVYQVSDGGYKFSFILPDYFDKKISDFAVYDCKLIAIYDHFVRSYELVGCQ